MSANIVSKKRQSERFKTQLANSTESDEEKTSSPALFPSANPYVAYLGDPKNHGKKILVPVNIFHTGSNHRTDLGDLSALKHQILTVGLIKPISAQLLDGKVTVISGHRRLASYRELDQEHPGTEELPGRFSTIPCIVYVFSKGDGVNKGNGHHRILIQAFENLGREDLHPIDEAFAISEAKVALEEDFGYEVSASELGKYLGNKHRKTIGQALIVASWPIAAVQLVRDNRDLFINETIKKLARRNISESDLLDRINLIVENGRRPIKKEVSSSFTKERLQLLRRVLREHDKDVSKLIYKNREILSDPSKRSAFVKALSQVFEDL